TQAGLGAEVAGRLIEGRVAQRTEQDRVRPRDRGAGLFRKRIARGRHARRAHGKAPQREVDPEAVADDLERALEVVGDRFGLDFTLRRFPMGAAGVAAAGDPFPEETRAAVTRADAVLLGALGDPSLDQAPRHLRPESGLR